MCSAPQPALRPHPATRFARLLAWLDQGTDSQGERYLEMRRRLFTYFDRRDRPAADALADETFDRVARTLEEQGVVRVTPPARYCFVVAKYVLLEDVRRAKRYVPLDESRLPAPADGHDHADRRRALACLGRCLDLLKPQDRSLLIDYYRDATPARIVRRRDLAAALGVTMNALAIRIWRLRAALETCIGGCRIDRAAAGARRTPR